ncbi:creatininase family protein [Haloarcula litorea]|uniref:creatininase family protein n=1 Tax=Haloarcula litorea TaxID=3032579 RepID=UPI0023E81F0E|nr:creatininase family protein [Halomicroarcula sp. GDY20]
MSTDTVELGEMTWTEVEAALDDGVDTAIVAVGAVEQHGPHLPLLTDTLRGDAIAERIADELGDAVVAPTIRPGCSGHHMSFPGTITVPPAVLMDQIRAYCRSLDEHGFAHVVLVPTHGGNFAPVNTVAPELGRELDTNVVALADLQELMELGNAGLADAGVDYREPVVHAGAVETAVLLAVAEDLVDTDSFEVGTEGEVSTARLLSEGMETITENGVLGDPNHATAAAGEAILDRVAEAYAEQVEAARAAVE